MRAMTYDLYLVLIYKMSDEMFFRCGGGQGGGNWEKRGREVYGRAREERAGSGILKVARSGRKRGELCNIVQYFTIEKMQRGGSQQIQGGNRELRVQEVGGLNPPDPLPPPLGGQGGSGES